MNFKIAEEPFIGSKRVITKFLWMPEVVENDFRWLEFATMEQEFMETDIAYQIGVGWVTTKFIDK